MPKGLRPCSSCHGEFPATSEFFFKHNQTKDGFHSWCKVCCKKGNLKSREKMYSTFEGRIKVFLTSCQRSALKRKQEFSLTAEDFKEMWEEQGGLCAYTGLPMELKANKLFSVSVERIDSDVGYTRDNTILVAVAVNRMKSDLRPEFFYEMCKNVTLWLSNDNLELDVEFKKYG